MSVLAHDCRYGPEADDGLPFKRPEDPVVIQRKENSKLVRIPAQRGSGNCDCTRRISMREALELVLMGRAVWKRRMNVNGRIVEGHGEVILLKAHPLHFRFVTGEDLLRGRASLKVR